MKALTVRNPWAWAIIFGGKDVENRSVRTHHIGTVAIHTAKAVDTEAMYSHLIQAAIDEHNTAPVIPGELIPRADLEQLGNIIGVVDINPAHHADHCRQSDGALCSLWAQEAMWHWPLINPRSLPTPVPAKGALGLWEWDNPGQSGPVIHAQEFSAVPFSFFCRCGYQSFGTEDDPALYEDHIRSMFA
ncbi:ASCH domain-containing protein [Arthrobacter sp. HLT1-20]